MGTGGIFAMLNDETDAGMGGVNQQIVRYVFRALYEADDLDEAVNRILEIVGTQFDVSRVYIFENQPDGSRTDNTYEWCNRGVEPEIENLKDLCCEKGAPGNVGEFDRDGVFFCPDTEQLAEPHRSFLRKQKIRSMIQCAIRNNGCITGFVGFDECRKNRSWTEEQIQTLSFISRLLGVFLLKNRAEKQMESQLTGLEEVLDELPGWVYVIDAATCQLYYLNQKTRETVPSGRIGTYCYREFMGFDRQCRACPAKEAVRTGRMAGREIYNGYLNVWSSASGIPIVWKGRPAVLMFLQDITKYKRAAAYTAMDSEGPVNGWENCSTQPQEEPDGQVPAPAVQDDSVAIYSTRGEVCGKLLQCCLSQGDRTVTAAALEIFENGSSFAESVQTLLGFLGRRYGLSRASLFMNDARYGGKDKIYQWVDSRTAVPIELSDSFRKEEFFLCHGLYDKRGIAVLSRDCHGEYPERLNRLLEASRARSALFAGVYIEGRYAGQLELVDCLRVRRWEPAAGELPEIVSLIASEAKAVLELDNAKRRAEYYRNVDLLTGLFTYDKFKREAQKALEQGGRKRVLVASDIKGFKYINNAIGYTQGDNVLRMMADMMVQTSGAGVINARVNGDVFVTLGVYEDQEQFLEDIERSNDDFAHLLNQIYDGVNLMIRSGVYFIEPDCREIGLAVDRANLARNSVDYILKSTVVVYKKAPFSKKLRENEMINRMEYALEHGEFQVYFQPKIRLADGSVAGAEALIRWIWKDGQVVPPGEFIPLFEKNGFITQVDLYVLEEVCKWLGRRAAAGLPQLPVSVNLSGVDVHSEDIAARIVRMVEEQGIRTGLLEFELTETSFMSDSKRAVQVVHSLRGKGFTTSIDDFGSGFSIMNMMTEIPADVIKLDCAFVQNCGKTARGHEFLGQLVQMIQKMGFVALCEGIETQENLDMVTAMGCDLGQGYYFSQPLPADEFEMWLQKAQFPPM